MNSVYVVNARDIDAAFEWCLPRFGDDMGFDAIAKFALGKTTEHSWCLMGPNLMFTDMRQALAFSLAFDGRILEL